jgi:DNA-binding NtrC family response regulator
MTYIGSPSRKALDVEPDTTMLPSDAASSPSELPDRKAVLTSGSKARVLVIDDDRNVADTLALVLKFGGYEADVAYSGEQGLELARQSAYDHLLTDVMMEPMNGIQVAVAMRAISPGCKVLLISGNQRTSQLLAEAVSDGYEFEILAKPVHPTVILSHLRDGRDGAHTVPTKEP